MVLQKYLKALRVASVESSRRDGTAHRSGSVAHNCRRLLQTHVSDKAEIYTTKNKQKKPYLTSETRQQSLNELIAGPMSV
jgi:hypothetical protein